MIEEKEQLYQGIEDNQSQKLLVKQEKEETITKFCEELKIAKPIDKNDLKKDDVVVEVEVDPTSVIVYGVIADLFVIVPIIIYLTIDNVNGYA